LQKISKTVTSNDKIAHWNDFGQWRRRDWPFHADAMKKVGDEGVITVEEAKSLETDLLSKGIIDPTKVVRTALQDAASIADLLVTTEAMMAELPKKQASAPATPGGGMGGMDY